MLLIRTILGFILLNINRLTYIYLRLPTFVQREQATLSVFVVCSTKIDKTN